MKLYLNKPSPYARLVMVVAHEKGLAERLDLEWTDPWVSPEILTRVNPFSRVPALVLDDGGVLVDSSCICDYLDGVGGGRALLPAELERRVKVLRKLGIAKTLTDAAFGSVIERRFNGAGSEPPLAARWLKAADTSLDVIERDESFSPSTDTPDLGDLALGVALGYIDFRLKELEWRRKRARLGAWFERIKTRPSMQATPHE